MVWLWKPLEELTTELLSRDAHLCEIKPTRAFVPKKTENLTVGKRHQAANPAYGATIIYHLKTETSAPPDIVISTVTGEKVIEIKGGKAAGLNRLVWNLKPPGDKPEEVQPGEYTVTLKVGDRTLSRTLTVRSPVAGTQE